MHEPRQTNYDHWLAVYSSGRSYASDFIALMPRTFAFVASFTLFWIHASAAEAPRKIEFNRDVRPILSDNCFLCHGPDKNTRKAKMRLDIREEALAKKAFDPGKPESSELVKRILSKEDEEIMPPPESTKKLSEAQKTILKEWIASGAAYEAHWAYTPLVKPPIPDVREREWLRTPIDAFVLKPLEAKGIKPSTEADRATLLRRLSLDLTGLPPEPEVVKAFLSDTSGQAYEKQVDRLLASAHFGERMAVFWLDVARFSDTVGYHGDQNQRIFPYRDYVISAFNSDKPFDQFTIEQLAGDLLPNPTTEQIVATGFNRLNMVTREGGAQPKEYLAKYGADRVRTVAGAWLGSTMGCCECHDHKFDPFSSRDFYSMKAFFADVKQWGVYADYGYSPNPELKGVGNEHPFAPEIEVESPYLKERIARFRKKLGDSSVAAMERLSTQPPQAAAAENWRSNLAALLKASPDAWTVLTLTESPAPPQPAKAKGAEGNSLPDPNAKSPADKKPAVEKKPAEPVVAQAHPDGSIVWVGKAAKGGEEKLPLKLPAGWLSAIRVELVPQEQFGGKFTRDNSDSTNLTLSASVRAHDGKEMKLAFYFADADKKEEKWANGASLLGILKGWKTAPTDAKSRHSSLWLLEKPVDAGDGATLQLSIHSDNVGSVRVSVSPISFERPGDAVSDELRRSLENPWTKLDPAGRGVPASAYLLGTGVDAEHFVQAKALRKEIYECRNAQAGTMVTQAQTPLETRLLPRGNWQDEKGELTPPAVPHFLPQPKSEPGRRLTRLDLARWLVSGENPLTGRAVMNRLWKQFFGNGISGVVDDLGAQGEWPTHPELLDWLAVDFRENGWSIKRAIRQIVLSNAYRQSSNLRAEWRDWDPSNRYLSSQNPRRLDAEFVRDNALSIAGLINLDIGGPSVKPYQPPGYYANLQFPDRNYVAETDDRQYRRGVYMHWQRTFLHPMLANFDAPMRDECTCNRPLSNTPQQALTLLNDPTFFESARVFAERVMKTAGDESDVTRISRAYELALARAPKEKELQSLKEFLAAQRTYFGSHPADAEKVLKVGLHPADKQLAVPELAAWTSLCRVVLNLHETITRY